MTFAAATVKKVKRAKQPAKASAMVCQAIKSPGRLLPSDGYILYGGQVEKDEKK